MYYSDFQDSVIFKNIFKNIVQRIGPTFLSRKIDILIYPLLIISYRLNILLF